MDKSNITIHQTYRYNVRWASKGMHTKPDYNVLIFEAPHKEALLDKMLEAYEGIWTVNQINDCFYIESVNTEFSYSYKTKAYASLAIQGARAEIRRILSDNGYDMHQECAERPCEDCTTDNIAVAYDSYKRAKHGEGK